MRSANQKCAAVAQHWQFIMNSIIPIVGVAYFIIPFNQISRGTCLSLGISAGNSWRLDSAKSIADQYQWFDTKKRCANSTWIQAGLCFCGILQTLHSDMCQTANQIKLCEAIHHHFVILSCHSCPIFKFAKPSWRPPTFYVQFPLTHHSSFIQSSPGCVQFPCRTKLHSNKRPATRQEPAKGPAAEHADVTIEHMIS